jgi:ABC-type dipeptide/oligopeptide/nickel transport system permease component
MRPYSKPAWWLIEALLVLFIGLLLLDHFARLSPAWHHVFLLMIIALVYSGMSLWLRTNREALVEQESTRRKPDKP